MPSYTLLWSEVLWKFLKWWLNYVHHTRQCPKAPFPIDISYDWSSTSSISFCFCDKLNMPWLMTASRSKESNCKRYSKFRKDVTFFFFLSSVSKGHVLIEYTKISFNLFSAIYDEFMLIWLISTGKGRHIANSYSEKVCRAQRIACND